MSANLPWVKSRTAPITRRASLAAILGLATMGPGLPAPASAVVLPVIDAQPTDGNEWVVYRIAVPAGADWAINIPGGPHDARAWGGGVWVTDLITVVVTGWGIDESRAYVATHATGPVIDHGDPRVTDDTYNIGVTAVDAAEESEFTIVAAAVGAYRGTFTLYGTEGVTILARSTGTDAGILMDEDFGGAAHAHIGVSAFSLAWAGAGGGSGISTTAEIDHRLYGWFQPGAGIARWMGPEGMGGLGKVFEGGPPGRYTFEIAAALTANHQWLWFADVEAP